MIQSLSSRCTLIHMCYCGMLLDSVSWVMSLHREGSTPAGWWGWGICLCWPQRRGPSPLRSPDGPHRSLWTSSLCNAGIQPILAGRNIDASVRRGNQWCIQNTDIFLKDGEGEAVFVCVWMLARVGLCAPTCSGADKLQNQGPAGDNARSTGQKVPEERQPIKTHSIKPVNKACIKEFTGMGICDVMVSSSWGFFSFEGQMYYNYTLNNGMPATVGPSMALMWFAPVRWVG